MTNPFHLTSAEQQNPNVQSVATLALIWEQDTGFRIPISTQDIVNMATTKILPGGGQAPAVTTTMFDIGQYMSDLMVIQGNHALQTEMPWGQWGLSEDAYRSMHADYATTYKQLTGQDIPDAALSSAFKDGAGQWTAAQYEQSLKNSSSIQNQFGWIKYGLDYLGFQQEKLKMNPAFGHTLSDAEATSQLQAWHANAGQDQATRGITLSKNEQDIKKAGTVIQ